LSTTSRHIYSVSELNRAAKQILDIELPSLWLEGEISNLSRPASGHWYFSLKDEKAQVRCAMFKRANSRVKFNVANGDKVLLRGKVSLYEARGDYQLIAEQMEDSGIGALQRAYEELRDKLAKEGLFAAEHKQDIPDLPACVGVITSSTGAALQDILQVLERRLPLLEIKVYPVLVQGALAPAKTPIISAVGHEVDFTILDFVADLRAPTPSAAAELATSITQDDLTAQIRALYQYLVKTSVEHLQKESQKLDYLSKRLKLAHPGQGLKQQKERFQSQKFRLHELLQRALQEHSNTLHLLELKKANLGQLIGKLNTLSPLATLERGYALVQLEDDKLVSSVNELTKNQNIITQLKDGQIESKVIKLNKKQVKQ